MKDNFKSAGDFHLELFVGYSIYPPDGTAPSEI
jgi:hypothetical protein